MWRHLLTSNENSLQLAGVARAKMDPGVDDRTHATRNYSRLMTGQEYTFSSSNVASREPDELVEEVRKNVLGSQQVDSSTTVCRSWLTCTWQMFIGPYGDRKLTYADFTASGKNVEFIEAFIHDVVRVGGPTLLALHAC